MKINNKYSKDTIKKEYTAGSPGHVKSARYFYFDNVKKKNTELAILCGGYEQCESDFEISRTKFPFFGLVYTISGKGKFTLNSKDYPLHYGSLSVFGPNVPYRYVTDIENPMEQIFIIFIGSQAKELLEKSRLKENAAVSVSNPESTLSILKQLLENGFNQNTYTQEICCNYLKSILLEQASISNNLYSKSVSFESFLKCKTFLENNFTRIESSNQLAEECCMDIRYIARLFRKYEHKKPHECLIHLKMNKAANLLITSKLNVNQIARMAGIKDAYHFSRLFKRRFKVSPTEYRSNPISYLNL
ncbi:MAG: AraC family transcriptional regulator [Phycisphaerales bacterium]